MRKPSRSFALRVAYGWHGGQFSALYSFASTGGTIHDEAHRRRLIEEIDSAVSWCEVYNARRAQELRERRGPDDYGREPHRLARLRAFINATPTKGA